MATAAPAPAPADSNIGHLVTSILAEHESLRAENADLRAQLAVARAHADPAAGAMIADLQARYERERELHVGTRAALNALRAAWAEYDAHAAAAEARVLERRRELARAVDASAGFAPLPLPPSTALAGPARTLPAFAAQLPIAPLAQAPARRHAADAIDERAPKRPRAEREMQMPRAPQHLTGPGSDGAYLAALTPSFAFAPAARPARPARAHADFSLSPEVNGGTLPLPARAPGASLGSRASSRSRERSLSVDDMLLDAAGESPLLQTPHADPAPQAYQNHVFQPPVTGAPAKRPQAPAADNIANEPTTSLNGGGGSRTPIAPPPGGFPATNDKGQRLCRQCGLPGRYKDGKCVEKWGPGPGGPGTVCDRCRKKMKRVERRSTMDPAAAGAAATVSPPSSHDASERVGAAKTLPAGVAPAPTYAAQHHQQQHAAGSHPPITTFDHLGGPSGRSDLSDIDIDPQEEQDGDGDGEGDDDVDLDDDLLAAVDASETNGPGGWAVKREGVEI